MGSIADRFRRMASRRGDAVEKLSKGIRRRWMTNTLGISLIIVVIAIAAFVVALSNTYYSALRSKLEEKATAWSGFFGNNYNRNHETYYTNALKLVTDFTDKDKVELQFINTSYRIDMTSAGYGRLEIDTTSAGYGGLEVRTPDVENALKNAELYTWSGDDPYTGERVMAVSAPLMSGTQVIGAIRYVTSLTLVDREIWWMMGIALMVGIAFILILTFTNLVFIRGIVTPIQEINVAAKRIAEGRYGTRIEKHYDDEIGELADNINHMSIEISAAERMKSDFISSISHELRSPLTAIKGWGETLLSADIDDPAEIKKGVSIMLKETVRLIKLVEELLDFTRMEGGQMRVQLEELNVALELEEVVYMYMDAMRREGITLEYHISGEIPPVKGDRARLKQVFLNLLDNASKHGGEGKRIEVSIWRAVDDVIIQVRDYGQGIPPEELPHVKYKFYKGSSKARGSGIGLAISDEIIRLHDGELSITSEVGKGTEVQISIPVHERTEEPQP